MPIDAADVAICLGEDAVDGAAGARPLSTPIVQTSLFAYPDFRSLVDGLADEYRHNVYSRGRNPTVQSVEERIARLERGEACICFASGIAAVSAVLLGLLRAGDHVLFVNQVYAPALQLAAHLGRFGIEHDVVLDVEPHRVARALRPETRLVWLESPGTMLFRMVDVPAVAELARARGVLTCLDNSWATPLHQKPLELGVDIVVHSASKYLAGHSDMLAGAVVSGTEIVERVFHNAYMLNGGLLPPFEAWLLERGLRTLPVRLARQEEDALRVARHLASHPAVRRVHHPALDEGDEMRRQLRGYSGLFSFELARPDFDSVAGVLDRLRRFRLGVSWGGIESVAISPERRDDGSRLDAHGLPRGLIRLSIGLEGADALIEDLDRALEGGA